MYPHFSGASRSRDSSAPPYSIVPRSSPRLPYFPCVTSGLSGGPPGAGRRAGRSALASACCGTARTAQSSCGRMMRRASSTAISTPSASYSRRIVPVSVERGVWCASARAGVCRRAGDQHDRRFRESGAKSLQLLKAEQNGGVRRPDGVEEIAGDDDQVGLLLEHVVDGALEHFCDVRLALIRPPRSLPVELAEPEVQIGEVGELHQYGSPEIGLSGGTL